MLSDLGAEVVKLEMPPVGDFVRGYTGDVARPDSVPASATGIAASKASASISRSRRPPKSRST